jgi:hypothetical protein
MCLHVTWRCFKTRLFSVVWHRVRVSNRDNECVPRTLMACSSFCASTDCKTGTTILSSCSGSLKACTSKLTVLPSGFKVYNWRQLTSPAGRGGTDCGRMGASATTRCLLAWSRPSVGSLGAGRLRLDSSKISTRVRCMRSKYCCILPLIGFSGFLDTHL